MDVWHDGLQAFVVTVTATAALVWYVGFVGVGWGLYIHISFSTMTWAGGLYIRTPFKPRILRLSQRCHGCVARGLLEMVVTVLTAVGVARWFVGVGFLM